MRSETYHVSDHLHKTCLGRLLWRYLSPKKKEFLCAKCGQIMISGDIADMCFCGVEAGQYGRILQCVPNPSIRPELPNQIVVIEKKVEYKKQDITPSRVVRVPDEYENFEKNDD